MPYRWENRKRMAEVRGEGLVFHVCWFLGVIFAVLGVIGGAANITLGLEPTYWLLLSIATFAASIPSVIGLAIAWYLRTLEAKKEK